MGHSNASLYRYTSIGWPLTNGSCGRRVSLGLKSVDDASREPTLRAAARALALGLMDELFEAAAVVGEGRLDPGPEPLRSEAAERVLGPRGTIRFRKLWDWDDSV